MNSKKENLKVSTEKNTFNNKCIDFLSLPLNFFSHEYFLFHLIVFLKK